jgi:hypothetical protein
MMQAILTGDIVDSRKVDSETWLNSLKTLFSEYGVQPKDWEIYRGDSFQIKTEPLFALKLAYIIKANIKKFSPLDARIGIGIGDINYQSDKLSESNGNAFIYAGESFDGLKTSTLAIKSTWHQFDLTINTMLDIFALTADDWTSTSAEIILKALQRPELNQKQLAVSLNKKSQSAISAGLKRGGYDELLKLLNYYQQQLKNLC